SRATKPSTSASPKTAHSSRNTTGTRPRQLASSRYVLPTDQPGKPSDRMRAGKTTRGQNRTNTPRRPGVLHRRDNTPVGACQDLPARWLCRDLGQLFVGFSNVFFWQAVKPDI